jgi:hypothetical protein
MSLMRMTLKQHISMLPQASQNISSAALSWKQ